MIPLLYSILLFISLVQIFVFWKLSLNIQLTYALVFWYGPKMISYS